MQFSWSNANLRTGAAHPWSDFSGCGCTRRTHSNVIPVYRFFSRLNVPFAISLSNVLAKGVVEVGATKEVRDVVEVVVAIDSIVIFEVSNVEAIVVGVVEVVVVTEKGIDVLRFVCINVNDFGI